MYLQKAISRNILVLSSYQTLPPVKIVHGEVEASDAEPLLQQEQDLVLQPLSELTQAQDSILYS
jgi:hypothetical protein